MKKLTLRNKVDQILKNTKPKYIAGKIVNLVKKEQAKNIKDIKNNIGFLRQWLNEKPKDKLITNKDIEEWLFE